MSSVVSGKIPSFSVTLKIAVVPSGENTSWYIVPLLCVVLLVEFVFTLSSLSIMKLPPAVAEAPTAPNEAGARYSFER